MPENEYSFQLKHIYGDYKNAICSCYEKFRSSTGYEYLRVFFFLMGIFPSFQHKIKYFVQKISDFVQ